MTLKWSFGHFPIIPLWNCPLKTKFEKENSEDPYLIWVSTVSPFPIKRMLGLLDFLCYIGKVLQGVWDFDFLIGGSSIKIITFPRCDSENIIPRNEIINWCAAEVDNHISKDDIFDYHPLRNVIFILLYRTLFFHFLPLSLGSSKGNTMHNC